MTSPTDPARKTLIAHRGASAYAPEHTIEAYELAIEQGADFIEPDLQITNDGVPICLHDLTLERTTNAVELFPDRGRAKAGGSDVERRWYASDFSLAEIKRLDAGSWFHERYAGCRVPTLEEAMELARGRAGIYPETKAPEVYGSLGLDMERILVEVLERHGLAHAGPDSPTPVVIQSFSDQSLEVLRQGLGVELPLVLLFAREDPRLSSEGLARVSKLADGIGPAKEILLGRPEIVEQAHAVGLEVASWTFRADDPGRFENVKEEMEHFLYDLGIDAVFTNNPDLFPRRGSREG